MISPKHGAAQRELDRGHAPIPTQEITAMIAAGRCAAHRRLAHYYRQYARLMEHWRATLPSGVMLDVPYEALVGDPEGWSRKMLEFIALPWDARCKDFHRTAAHSPVNYR